MAEVSVSDIPFPTPLAYTSSPSCFQSSATNKAIQDPLTYTEMVVYRCAASAVSWILIRRKICGPDELYELGKIALLSVDEGKALVLLLLGGFMEDGASVPLDESAFLILATREGLRCIFPSRILFCCTGKNRTIINNFYKVSD